MYIFELPTTGAVSFADFCIDNTHALGSRISEATGARANVRATLKESKRTDGERDYLKVVKVCDLDWFRRQRQGLLNIENDDLIGLG